MPDPNDSDEPINLRHDVDRHEDDITQLRADLAKATKELAAAREIIAILIPGLQALDRISLIHS